MDPLSICASVVSIAALAGSLAQKIGRFVVKTKTLSDSITEFHESIDTLQIVLNSIHEALKGRTRQLPFERSHHVIIFKILQSCERSLETLDQELPELRDRTSSYQRIRQTLEKSLKEQRIQEILYNINQRTTVLQLSLTTLSLGAQAGMQRSQDQIHAEIRKLTDSMRSAKLTWMEDDGRSVTLASNADPDDASLSNEIRDWKKTADDVAVAVSLNDLAGDGRTFASGLPIDAPPAYPEDGFDPEPDLKDHPSHDILKLQFEANQDFVRRLVQCGIYQKAATYQRKGIELREQLNEHNPCEPDELANMKETLADILLECETPAADMEGKTTLQRLLEEEVAIDEDKKNPHRRCRLYHKLGALYLKQNSVSQARRMLRRAFEGRKAMHPMPRDLVEHSAELLVKVLQLDQAFDEAHGLGEWIRRELHQEQTPPSTPPGDGLSLSKLYQWCQESGMDIESGTFGFDTLDSHTGMTPLHRAIEEENVDILTDMVLHVAHVDVEDSTGSTPLLLAAATKNKKIVRLLLDRGARPDARDLGGMTALHRCQSQSGGLYTAEMLLAARPGLVDEVDNFSKTALFLACEKGNEKMVRLLLGRGGANANIQGPGQCTPLLVAIEVVAKSARKIGVVDLLMRHGADPAIPDKHKRTAFDAASNAGLASSEVKRLLGLACPRRLSTLSVASTARSLASSKSS